ncbi:arginine vasopressin-induced protein 1 [Scleropages formosus]|uniref:arginine vasopressin-induced protein 1 n=1 Tax=Scleropages formosus TaxID=113540 RepID=UPI0010FA63E4|nr:arginine vasopressin-induced protein 1 [Scleropages formosus]XP_029114639.1 arginine vasopressin-induced protein 1 [Scleropages formosus]
MGDPVPSSAVAPSPQFWQLTECRGRRCGSPNIFQGVGVRQLRRLFRLSGDGKASRRAQLVWSHSDGKQLARALVTLRAQSRRGHPRPPKWLRAFNHLRIGEVCAGAPSEDSKVHLEKEPLQDDGPELTSSGPSEGEQGIAADDTQADTGQPQEALLRSTRNRPGVSRGAEEDRDPERYLHHVLH